MPIAELFDGTRLEFPDGTDPAVIAATAKKVTFQRKAQAANKAQAEIANNGASGQALMQQGLDPTEGNSVGQNAFIGVGKAITDTGRGLGQLVGLVSNKDVAESRARDEALMNTGGGLAGNIGGSVGMALLPGAALKGAGTLAQAGGAARAAQLLNTAGNAAMVPKSILGAGTLGAAQGFIAPSTNLGERALNTGLGSVASMAVPAVIRGGAFAKRAIEPFYDAGQDAIIGRTLKAAAGGDEAVVGRLANARELVPGSVPTVGQAGSNAGLAALERSASAVDPSVTRAFDDRMAQQAAARSAAIGKISGTAEDRALMEGVRDLMSESLYDQARKIGIPKDVAKANAPLVQNLLDRMPKGVLENAQELARVKGEKLGAEGSVNGLHWVKKSVDDLISKAPQTGMGKETKDAYLLFKKDLLSTLDELSPKYGEGRKAFESWSKPINAMEVGQAFADKSSALTGRLRPEAFATALRNGDDIARQATGFKGATLSNTLNESQIGILNSVKDDLARANYAQTAGKGVGSDTIQKLAYSNIMEGSGVPTWLRDLAPTKVVGGLLSRGSDAAYGRANRELASKLANVLMDPKEAARIMQQVPPAEREALLAQALRLATPLGMAAPGLLYGAVPGLLNASQQ